MSVKKTVLMTALTLCAALCVFAAPRAVAGAAADGGAPYALVHGDHAQSGFSAVSADTEVLSGSADALNPSLYYLQSDVKLTGNISVEGCAELCLNGFKLDGRDDVGDINGPVITVKAGARFTLCDCGDSAHSYYVDEEGCYVFYEGSLPADAPDGAVTGTINGGVVTGGILSNKGVMENVYYAAAVQVEESAVFNLESGTIAGNVVADVSGGTVVNVAENAVFNMTGGAISGNVGRGANVYVLGEFNMHGGEISDNIAQTGGGVSVSRGVMLMNGGKITGNIGRGGDGGVEVLGGEFTMNGGEITENRARRGDGGAVSVGGYTLKESVFIMNGGTIANNKAYNLTDGVYVHRDGTFILNDGYFQGKCGTERSTSILTINGGYFAVGEPEKNTVEGITLTDGKGVMEIYDGFGDENFKEEFPFAVYNLGETVLALSAKAQKPVYDGEVLAENKDFYVEKYYKCGAEKFNADAEYSYASADGAFVSGLPSDAGEYTLKATVRRFVDPVKKIYCPAAEEIAKIKVEKAVPQVSVPSGLTALYGDKLSAVALPAGWAWKDGGVWVGSVGEKIFSAVYTPADTDNYLTVEEDLAVTVNKARPAVSIPSGLTAVYGDKLSAVALPAGWTWKDGNVWVGSAGDRTFAAVYTPADTVNYLIIEENLPVRVNKARPVVDIPSGLTAVYGDKLSAVALPAGWSWKDGDASVGNAGNRIFAAVYTPADADNYLTVEENLTVKVNKARPAVDVPSGLTAVYGDKLSAVALPAGWSWKDGDASVGSVGERTFAAVYTPADADNYMTVDENLTVKVNKALPQVAVPQGLTAAVGQTLADIKLPHGWVWADPSLEVGEKGEKTFTAVYTADDTVNYDTLTMQLKVKVKRVILSTGEIIAVSAASAVTLLAAAYAVFLALYKKGAVAGAFFRKIYPFVKK